MDWWFNHLFNKQIYELPDTSENAKILKEVYNMKSTRVIINVLLSLGLPKVNLTVKIQKNPNDSQWISHKQPQLFLKLLDVLRCLFKLRAFYNCKGWNSSYPCEKKIPSNSCMKPLFFAGIWKTSHVSFAIEFAILNCSLQLKRAVLADEVK